MRAIREPWSPRLPSAFLTTVGAFAFACSSPTETYTADADRGSTHALVTIERREPASEHEASQARGFASFVRTPPEVDPSLVTRIAGLALDLPEAGGCALGPAREPGAALTPLRRVELLDAGDVTLETPEGRVALAPRAFPAVTSLVAGVVYSTRDLLASLPAGEAYALSASGSALLAPFSVSTEAPSALADVTLGGAPLGNEATLDPNGTELTWAPGASRDLVYVSVASGDGTFGATCAFRDHTGRGSLPSTAMPPSGSANLAVHRLRIVPLDVAATNGVDAGELRFDFARTAVVQVRPR